MLPLTTCYLNLLSSSLSAPSIHLNMFNAWFYFKYECLTLNLSQGEKVQAIDWMRESYGDIVSEKMMILLEAGLAEEN